METKVSGLALLATRFLLLTCLFRCKCGNGYRFCRGFELALTTMDPLWIDGDEAA
jgi:hypothetical protein